MSSIINLVTSIIMATDLYSAISFHERIFLPAIHLLKEAIHYLMSVKRLTQLLSESSSWKRLLGFLMEENTHCKNRLSEILNNDFQIRLLADMENFQTDFIQTDTMIALLRYDVAVFD